MEETEKLIEQGLLYDFYGPLLTGHQQKIYEEAVYENLSLTEIAELEHISRQAVSDLLRRTTVTLQEYEKKLGVIRRTQQLRKTAGKLRKAAQSGTEEEKLRCLLRNAADEIEQELQ